ncbi:hypothetical protein F5I97DRAFT_1895761 [Phlebopus sp. FC_14]|nr:hypothetical protein F5I97DRAFT_1895761 [Phlebopus sp. FC_14]
MSYIQSSVVDLEELDSLHHDSIQAELNNWQRILFHGDMDGSQKPAEKRSDQAAQPGVSNSSRTNEDPTSANPHHLSNAYIPGYLGPPHVPPETYNYLIHALLSLQGSVSHPYPQSQSTYPHAGPADPSPLLPQGWQLLSSGVQLPTGSIPTSDLPSIYAQPSISGVVAQNAAGPSCAPLPLVVPSSGLTESNSDQTDEATSIAEEDKRRRNTAASARFRIKKKQKTLNLERTVADLTGRTEELEREAADLRRENGWLKEIILLKGRNFGAFGEEGSAQSTESSGQAQGLQAGKDNNDSDSESESATKRSKKGKGKER